jgi:hypothetical protein
MHKNVRSSTVETILESEVSLRNYREKMEEIRMVASMPMTQLVSARVNLCQLQLGGTFSSQKGFYVVMN